MSGNAISFSFEHAEKIYTEMTALAEEAESEIYKLRNQRDILSELSLQYEVSELDEQIRKLMRVCDDIRENAEKLRRITEHYEETERLAADIVSKLPERNLFNDKKYDPAARISPGQLPVFSDTIYSGNYIAREEWLDDLIFEWRGEHEQV